MATMRLSGSVMISSLKGVIARPLRSAIEKRIKFIHLLLPSVRDFVGDVVPYSSLRPHQIDQNTMLSLELSTMATVA
jgi:hypothetical protein